MTKNDLIDYLIKNVSNDLKDEYKKPIYHEVNEEKWTLAELFIRQHLNNNCNGFGMKNVSKVYDYLKTIKNDLISWNLISEKGFNNSGFTLWKNYNF